MFSKDYERERQLKDTEQFLNELKEELQPLQEMARIITVESGKAGKLLGIENGVIIEVITSEYKDTGEEPHFHLFPGNHKDKKGKANNYDLITRVKITKELPKSKDDIVAIKDNKAVPEDYKNFIYNWSKKTNKFGFNNWLVLQNMWNSIQSKEVF